MENKVNTDKTVDENKSTEKIVLTNSTETISIENVSTENSSVKAGSNETDSIENNAVEQIVETPIIVKPSTNKELIAYLSEKFPLCFSLKGTVKPLKIGIFQELAEKLVNDENVSKTRLRQILRHYTSSWRYLKAIKLGTQRVNLQGEGVEEIDQAQADYALKTLQESQEKFGYKKTNKPVNKTTSLVQGKSDETATRKTNTERATKSKNTDKTAYKRDNSKFKGVKANRNSTKKPEVKLEKIDQTAIKIGQAVKVKLGKAPMDALVKELSGNDVSVELVSGMVVKTKLTNLYTQVVLEKEK